MGNSGKGHRDLQKVPGCLTCLFVYLPDTLWGIENQKGFLFPYYIWNSQTPPLVVFPRI
jgi:hypothetical protein